MDAAPPPNIPLSTPEESYNPNTPSPQGQAQTNYLQGQFQTNYPQGQVQTNYPQVQAFQFNYKIQNNAERRREEYNKIRSLYPDRIPIICEKDPKSNVSNTNNNKYLLPKDSTIFEFILMIKKRINPPVIAELFLLVNGRDLLSNDSSISEVYQKYKDPEDDLLYIAYTDQIPPSKYPQGQVSSKPFQNQSYSSSGLGQAFLFKFKADYNSVEERKKECEKLHKQFPGKIPIVCEKDPKSKIRGVDKNKYLIPEDLTVSEFILLMRKKIEVPNESAFYLLANGRNSIVGDIPLSDIYEKYKDPEDGFLYIAYTNELPW